MSKIEQLDNVNKKSYLSLTLQHDNDDLYLCDGVCVDGTYDCNLSDENANVIQTFKARDYQDFKGKTLEYLREHIQRKMSENVAWLNTHVM